MNPFNALSSRKKLGLVTDRASEMGSSELAKWMEENRKAPPEAYTFGSATLKPPMMTGGFESKPMSMSEEAPKQYSLGADTDLKKALAEDSGEDYSKAGSEAIKAGGQALGTVAKEAAAQRALESEMGQKAALQAGKSSREARQKAGRGTHRALAELIASFRSASQ